MADSKISALSAVTALAGTDEFVLNNGGASKKVTAANMQKFMPGYEISYAEITTNANITDTSEATATSLISPGAVTFDGTPVIVEAFGVMQSDTAALGDNLIVSLFEGSTQITRLWIQRAEYITAADLHTMYARYRFTPTAASHTYKLTAFVPSTTGTPKILAGSGGTGGQPPAFLRFTKA